MMAADIAKVKRNIQKMIGAGAPESDIDAYIAGEGTTIDEVRAFKGQPTGSAMEAAQGYTPPSGPQWRPGGMYAVAGVNPPAATPAQPEAPAQPSTGGVVGQGMSGVNEGIANAVGFPIDAVNSALGGLGLPVSKEPVLGSQFWKNVMGSPAPGTGAVMIRPPAGDASTGLQGLGDPSEAFARTAGQGVGSMAVMGPATGMGVLPSLATGLGSGVGEATAGSLTGDNPVAMGIGGAVGGGATGLTIAGINKYLAARAAAKDVPTVEDLKALAGAKYDEAAATGVSFKQDTTKEIADGMRAIASGNGLISPTGRLSTAYPKINSAIRTFDDYAKGAMSVDQMKAVRTILSDAAGSAEPGEARIGYAMLKQFDSLVGKYIPQLADARGLYTRAMRGQEIEDAMKLAESRAPAVGWDKAVQDEFKKLNTAIIKGTLSVSDDEAAAIKDIAMGGNITQKVARYAGKLMPRSPVGFATGQGVPFAIGSAIGGPAVGAAAAGGTTALGVGGSMVADSLAKRAADTVSLIARNGGSMPPSTKAAVDKVTAAILAAQAANATTRPPAGPQR